jgi:hypothetical protein
MITTTSSLIMHRNMIAFPGQTRPLKKRVIIRLIYVKTPLKRQLSV